MLYKTLTASFSGIEGTPVNVQVDIGKGLPSFSIVGLGDTSVKEAGKRVRSAIINSGFQYPGSRITVNLSPAWIHKKGSHFDLPIAIAVLQREKIFRTYGGTGDAFIGELNLDGSIMPVRGVLPMLKGLIEKDVNKKIKRLFIPEGNYYEGAAIAEASGIEIVSVGSLRQTAEILCGLSIAESYVSAGNNTRAEEKLALDFKDVKGHWAAKDAIVTAIAGNHSLLMIGPPGTGKTMLARRIPGILPPLTMKQKLETSAVYSLLGMLDERLPVISAPPFRRLSLTDTPASILGGGNEPLPGEVSMAHNGVLFIDEFLEMSRERIELLRKPLEEKNVRLIRRGKAFVYPADFLLVAAANPCRCGYLGDDEHSCICTMRELDNYRNRLSGPIMERIDMCIEIARVNYKSLQGRDSEGSGEMAEKVLTAREIQNERFKNLDIRLNSQMQEKHIKEFCSLNKKSSDFIKKAYERYGLSPRRYYKLLKVARTIADIGKEKEIQVHHLASALNYTRYFNPYEKE